MTKSRHWSNASAPCRLEWRPSRWFAAALFALGWLAALAAIGSQLPWQASIPVACLAILYGTWLARGELRRRARTVVIPPNATAAMVDGVEMGGLKVQWRGPLVLLHWRDPTGRRHCLRGWPDTLDAGARRELRLALAARAPSRHGRSMAT